MNAVHEQHEDCSLQCGCEGRSGREAFLQRARVCRTVPCGVSRLHGSRPGLLRHMQTNIGPEDATQRLLCIYEPLKRHAQCQISAKAGCWS